MKKLLKTLERFNAVMVKTAENTANICVAVQIAIVFCGTVWRYCFRSPLSWVDEMAALLMVVIAFLGCYIAMARHKLARIEAFIKLFHGRARSVVYIVSECIAMLMILFVVIYGVKLFLSPTSLGQKTAGMGIPLSIFYFLIPATFVLNFLLSVTDILHYIYDDPDQVDKEIESREGFSV